MVPFTGLSTTTVVIGLGALRAHDPGARRSSRGCAAVPDEVVESARGLGYGTGRLLLRVELPLALPVIMAGLRVATVSTVALTTVGSLVAYGGLGDLIKDGVQLQLPCRAVHRLGAVRGARRAARRACIVRRPAGDDALDPGSAAHDRHPRRLGLPHSVELDRRRRACCDLLVAAAAADRDRAAASRCSSACRSRSGWATSAGAASWPSTSPTSAGRSRPSRCWRCS